MALAVGLLVLDAVRGRIRGTVVAWWLLVTILADPIPWGFQVNGQPWGLRVRFDAPNVLMAVVVILVVADLLRRRVRWYWLVWLTIAAAAFWSPPGFHHPRQPWPIWSWQLILVTSGFILASHPLADIILRRARTKAMDHAAVG